METGSQLTLEGPEESSETQVIEPGDDPRLSEPWEFRLVVPGPPRAWSRSGNAPIKNRKGDTVGWRHFDNQADWKATAIDLAKVEVAQSGRKLPFFSSEDAIRVLVLTFFGLPKSRELKRSTRPRDWHEGQRYDADNLAKIFMDSLQGILWPDDGRIVWLESAKVRAAQGEPEGMILLARTLRSEEVGIFRWASAQL